MICEQRHQTETNVREHGAFQRLEDAQWPRLRIVLWPSGRVAVPAKPVYIVLTSRYGVVSAATSRTAEIPAA